MNGVKGAVMIGICFVLLLSLPGCGVKENYIMDGSGMINTYAWEEFELSRSDSNYQYNFWFSLKSADGCYLLTGECSDEEGNRYESLDGIEVPNAEAEAIRREFALDELNDVVEDPESELILLDAPTVSLTLTYADGSKKEKSIGADASMDIYHALLPYFTARDNGLHR